MTLDIATHKTILFQILKDIYSDSYISPFLGFKGGTAALMFYGLDRFSVDLDFDLLETLHEDDIFERVIRIGAEYGSLKETSKKRFSDFCMLSYDDRSRNVKIEINRRNFGSRYEIKTYLGVSMQVMVPGDMVAHKLMAMDERMHQTSRDIYDVWFFLNKRFPINKKIIEDRAHLPFDAFVKHCIEMVENMDNRRILDGLGELLTPNQKDWARAKLREDTIALLKLRLSES